LIAKGYNGHCGDAVTAENPPIKELHRDYIEALQQLINQ